MPKYTRCRIALFLFSASLCLLLLFNNPIYFLLCAGSFILLIYTSPCMCGAFTLNRRSIDDPVLENYYKTSKKCRKYENKTGKSRATIMPGIEKCKKAIYKKDEVVILAINVLKAPKGQVFVQLEKSGRIMLVSVDKVDGNGKTVLMQQEATVISINVLKCPNGEIFVRRLKDDEIFPVPRDDLSRFYG